MNKHSAIIASLLCITFATAQEDYTTWTGHKNVILNTAISGANVSANVTNFPVLVRLSPSDSAIFIQSAATGADIRFTKANNTTRIPHQIEKWDNIGRSAAVWVLVDTVRGNINNQNIRVHWGKAGAADSSSGPAVFKTTQGFQAVWHMNSTTVNENDATANGLTLSAPTTVAAQPTINAAAVIGPARNFANGSSQYFIALNSAASAVSFPNASAFTLSAWINPTTNGQRVIVGKSDLQYSLQTNANSNYEGCDVLASWDCAPGSTPATGEWSRFVFVRTPTEGFIYVNGVVAGVIGTGPAATRNEAYNVTVGAMIAGTAPGTNAGATGANGTKSRYWNGSIDEVQLQNVSRDSNWIKLEYANQKPNQNLVSLADTLPALAVSPSIISQPIDKSVAQGVTVRFGVAATGTGTLTYLWVKNNLDTVKISLSATDSLSLTNVQVAENGATYKVVVRNSLGSAISRSALLNVNVAPAITSQPSAQTVNQNGTVKFGCGASGTSLTYKWVKNNTDTVKNGVATTSDTLAITNVPTTDNASTYKCVVSNPLGQVVSNSVGLTVVGILPGARSGSFGVMTTGTGLTFHLPMGISGAEFSVTDLWGRTVWNRKVGSGIQQLSWDGRANGRNTGAGIYLVRIHLLDASGHSTLALERKVLLTR